MDLTISQGFRPKSPAIRAACHESVTAARAAGSRVARARGSRSPRWTCRSFRGTGCRGARTAARPRAPRMRTAAPTRSGCRAAAPGGSAADARLDRQAEQLAAVGLDHRGQPPALEIVLGQRVIGRKRAVLQRQVHAGRRLAGARNADAGSRPRARNPGLRAVVVRECEVHRVDAHRVGGEVRQAVRPAEHVCDGWPSSRSSGPRKASKKSRNRQLRLLERVADLVVHERREHERPNALVRRDLVDPAPAPRAPCQRS